MDLNLSVSVSARHLPLDTFERIKDVIKWQEKRRQYHSPFKSAELIMNAYAEPAPAFFMDCFYLYNEISGDDQCSSEGVYTYRNMAKKLYDGFGFSSSELQKLDILLGFAAAEFKVLADVMDKVMTDFFIDLEGPIKIILDPDPGIEETRGVQKYWG